MMNATLRTARFGGAVRPSYRVLGISSRRPSHTSAIESPISLRPAPTAGHLRVLLANHGYPPEFSGGSEVYTQTLATELLDSGVCASVDVFAREHDAFRPDFSLRSRADTLNPRLTVQLINHAREAPYNRFASEPIEEKFRDVLRQLQPNVVHFGHLNHLSLNLPLIAQQEGAKTVYTLHDFWLMCPRGQFLVTGVTEPDGEPWEMCDGQEDSKCAQRCWVGRFATGLPHAPDVQDELAYWTDWIRRRMATIRDTTLPAIDAFVAPSVHLMQRFCQDFPEFPRDKTLLLPYGYNRQRLAGRNRNSHAGAAKSVPSPLVFAYIGRHQASKGLHLLIDAASQLVQQHPTMSQRFRILIFGRAQAAATPSLHRMLQESPLLAGSNPPIVEFRDEYANENIVSTVFDEVDAIVVPSIWEENSPLVIHEAHQANVPVITSERGGMGELVQHAINGLTFKHRDATSLAAAMRTAIEDPDYLQRLGRRGYLHSLDGQVPTVESHVNELVALYKRLLQGLSVQSEDMEKGGGEYDGLLRLASSCLPPISHSSPPPTPQQPDQPEQPEPIAQLGAPWRITFDTNPDDCNFSCTMCEQHSEYSPHQIARKSQGIRRRRMDFDLIKSTVEKMAPLGTKEIIPTTMGEPLMYKEFPAIVELCHKHGVKLNLTTNGSFYSLPGGPTNVEDWARLIVPVTSDVKFSWNGATEVTQQKIMKRSKLSSQISNLTKFIRVRDELAAVAAASHETPHRCSVTLQVTFMEDNLEEMPDIVRLAMSKGCDRVKGHHLWAHFTEIKDQDLRRSADSIARWNHVAAQCREIAGQRIRLENFYDLPISAAGSISGPDDITKKSPIHPAAVCPFLGKEAWVNHAGRFDPCCAPDIERELFLGSFGKISDRRNSIMEIWTSEKYKSLVDGYHNNPLCKGCNMRRPPAHTFAEQ